MGDSRTYKKTHFRVKIKLDTRATTLLKVRCSLAGSKLYWFTVISIIMLSSKLLLLLLFLSVPMHDPVLQHNLDRFQIQG